MELLMVEGMIRHVTVMAMISIIVLRLEVMVETVPDLVHLPGGIEDAILLLVVGIALYMVNMAMIAMVGGVKTVVVEEAVDVEIIVAAQTDSVGAQVQTPVAEQNSHYLLQDLSGLREIQPSARATSKVPHLQTSNTPVM
jgi:hypothetical protein